MKDTVDKVKSAGKVTIDLLKVFVGAILQIIFMPIFCPIVVGPRCSPVLAFDLAETRPDTSAIVL